MNRGFTLLEVLISVAIFLLIAGGIFESVAVTTRTSTDITLARLDSERIDSMQRFARLVFSNLPADAKVELRVRQGKTHGELVELLLSPVPSLADFSRNALETGGLSLAAVPDQAGAFTMCLANYDSEASPSDRDKQLEEARWLPILPGIKYIRWKFAAPDKPVLEEIWDAGKGRPVLADLEFAMTDGSKQHFQFAIPLLAEAKAAPLAQPSPAKP